MTTTLNLNENIVRLVEGLSHNTTVAGRKLELRARIERTKNDARIVFTGGLHGEASIWLSVSNEARIIAHWDGYLTAQAPQGAQYWYCVFSNQGREVGVRAWSYVGCGEAVEIARGQLSVNWEQDAVLVSCKPCQFN